MVNFGYPYNTLSLLRTRKKNRWGRTELITTFTMLRSARAEKCSKLENQNQPAELIRTNYSQSRNNLLPELEIEGVPTVRGNLSSELGMKISQGLSDNRTLKEKISKCAKNEKFPKNTQN